MKKTISLKNFFCLIILVLPLYLVCINIFGLPTNILELLAISAIIIFFAEKWSCLTKKIYTLPKTAFVAISLILIGALLSTLSGDSYASGFGILKSWFVVPILLSFAFYAYLDSEKSVEKIFVSIYFSSVFVGAVGIIYKIAGIVTYDNRLSAFYLSPNYLSMYLAPGIFFGLYFLIKSFQNRTINTTSVFHIISLIIIFIPFYFTYSYGAWLAVFLSLFVTAVFTTNKKRLLFLGLFLMFIGTIFIFQTNTHKFSDLFSERSSLSSRVMIWKASALMLKQHVFLGVGPGNFQLTYLSLQKYFPPYLEWAVPQPHNIFLAFWLQTGILGLSGFLLLMLFVIKKLLRIMKNKKDALLAAPLLCFFIYTLLHGLIDTPFWKNDLSFLFWICVFLTFFVYNVFKKDRDTDL